MEKEQKKKKTLLIISGILVLIALATGMTYAIYRITLRGQNIHKIDTDKITFTYTEPTNELIISNVVKGVSDTVGEAQTNYFEFQVKASSNKANEIPYVIFLTEVASTYSIPNDQVKLYLTKVVDGTETVVVNPTLISTLEQYYDSSSKLISSDNFILDGTSSAEQINTYRLRVWLQEDFNISSLITEGENTDGEQTATLNEYSYKLKIDVKTIANQDTSGANVPALATNMVPVYYDSTNDTWKIADEDNSSATYKWYNYDVKQWANAVMVKETGTQTRVYYTNQANVGQAVSMDDILAMYVWIPRFVVNTGGLTTQAYFESIRGTATTGTGSNGCASGVTCYLTPGAIDITFVNSSTTAHDAFTFGDQNLSGIWIGKFETGHTTLASSTTGNNLGCTTETCSNANGLLIKPSILSLRYNNVSNFFYATRSMSQASNSFGFDTTTDTTLDSHMIKSNEWGAVVYLDQSNYGRCTNGACTEISINNCSTYTTGIGGDTINAASSSTSCTTAANKYNGSYGVLASTTGNIYGIYDMSGGALDYVMGNYNSTIKNGGFAALPNAKYYNLYTTSAQYTTDNLQHALTEITGWYGDYGYFVDASNPWFFHGGLNANTNYGGIFYYNRDNGISYYNYYACSRASLIK